MRKAAPFALGVEMVLVLACAPRPAPRSVPVAEARMESPVPSPDPFVTRVRPVLARTCAPCHEPGGRMYERMPFDSPDVVRAHREGILRRLKEPDDRRAVEEWLDGPAL